MSTTRHVTTNVSSPTTDLWCLSVGSSSMSLATQSASVVPECNCMSSTRPQLCGVLWRGGRLHVCY